MARYKPLKTQQHVAEELATQYRRFQKGSASEKDFRAAVYGLQTLSNVLREGDLEARIEALESAAKGESQ